MISIHATKTESLSACSVPRSDPGGQENIQFVVDAAAQVAVTRRLQDILAELREDRIADALEGQRAPRVEHAEDERGDPAVRLKKWSGEGGFQMRCRSFASDEAVMAHGLAGDGWRRRARARCRMMPSNRWTKQTSKSEGKRISRAPGLNSPRATFTTVDLYRYARAAVATAEPTAPIRSDATNRFDRLNA
jgi:hypothetical protein